MTVVRVALLVWKPLNPETPPDVSSGWPLILQTRDAANPWQVPGVTLRPDEWVMTAAGRAAYALGLVLPNAPRVLAVDQRSTVPGRAEELVIVVDGGWVTGADVHAAGGTSNTCSCETRHERRWVQPHETGSVALTTALSAALMKTPAFVVNPSVVDD